MSNEITAIGCRRFIATAFTPFRRIAFALAAVAFISAHAQDTKNKAEPLMIQEQGSFAVGGKIITNPGAFNHKQPRPEGQTLRGDHAYVFYQIPVNRRKPPLVFLFSLPSKSGWAAAPTSPRPSRSDRHFLT